MKTNTHESKSDSTVRGSVAGSVHCTGNCTAPSRDVIDKTSNFDLSIHQPTPDPAPTTKCERGLELVDGDSSKFQKIFISGRGRRDVDLGLILQKRDRDILRVCYEQQFLLSDQVLGYFFSKSTERAGYQRINELIRFGYLRWVIDPMLDRKRLIRLTPLGYRAVEENLVLEVPQTRKPDIRTLRHDSLVTSARLRLSEIWTGSWLPEKAIKQEDFPRVPDGLFIFSSEKKVAVEVECSAKSRARFLGLVEAWRRIDVKLVLYITTAQYVFRLIQKYLSDGPQNVPFALARWEDLQNGTPTPVWTLNGPVNVFNRKEY